MFNKEFFFRLWQDSVKAMQLEVKRLVVTQDKDLIKHINDYYRIRILKGLWYSESFVNDHNVFMTELKEAAPQKYEQVKAYLLAHSTLISQDVESQLVRNIMMVGGVGTMVWGALRNSKKLLIISLGISAIGFFFNKYNQRRIIERADDIVERAMQEIGEEVMKILPE